MTPDNQTPEVVLSHPPETVALPDPDFGAKAPQPWKSRLSLASIVLWTTLITIFGASIGIGYYALRLMQENKLRDTWAILFLDLEQKGNRLRRQMRNVSDFDLKFATPPVAILYRKSDTVFETVSGKLSSELKASDFQMDTTNLAERFNLLRLSGKDFLAIQVDASRLYRHLGPNLQPGSYIILWNFDLKEWFRESLGDPDKNILYVVAREGRLLFSNDPDIGEGNYVSRPLVQKFISSPIHQGQLEFHGTLGPSFGFFFEVPDSNVMLFVETSKDAALAPVRETAVHFVIILVVLLSTVGLVLQFPLSSVVRPMRELVRLAWEIGEGNFRVQPAAAGFGEVGVLQRAFTDMGRNLNARDERIQLLLVEQQEKFRLEGELAVANSIQNNFLFTAPLPESSGLEVATRYVPAAKVAGDWYSCNESNGETVFAIADVSGHGTGSAMFTSIIAALFEECRLTGMSEGTFPTLAFFERLNYLFLRLGHGKIHATVLLARYQKGSGVLELTNAGHPFPFVIFPEESGQDYDTVMLRSDYLGMNQDFAPAQVTIDFPKHHTVLLYTDGLIEGRSDHKLFSERKLRKAMVLSSTQPIQRMVDRIEKDWRKHLDGEQALDDLCLLAVRAR